MIGLRDDHGAADTLHAVDRAAWDVRSSSQRRRVTNRQNRIGRAEGDRVDDQTARTADHPRRPTPDGPLTGTDLHRPAPPPGSSLITSSNVSGATPGPGSSITTVTPDPWRRRCADQDRQRGSRPGRSRRRLVVAAAARIALKFRCSSATSVTGRPPLLQRVEQNQQIGGPGRIERIPDSVPGRTWVTIAMPSTRHKTTRGAPEHELRLLRGRAVSRATAVPAGSSWRPRGDRRWGQTADDVRRAVVGRRACGRVPAMSRTEQSASQAAALPKMRILRTTMIVRRQLSRPELITDIDDERCNQHVEHE